MNERPIVLRLGGIPSREVERAHGASIQVLLGDEQGMPNFYTRRFTILPGGSIPKHRHDLIEHVQVVLEGEMVLTLDGEAQRVQTGDTIYIPAGVSHAYANQGPVPIRFLCIVPAAAGYSTEWLD